MKNKVHVRVTQFKPPPHNSAAYLRLVAYVSEPEAVMEGFLLDDITVRAPIRLRQRFRDGVATMEEFASSPVVRIEDGYVATADAIFQILRVPGPKPAPGTAKAASKTPVRTTISKREYFHLKEGLYAQMADIAPDLALVAALFKLHLDQFTRVGRDMPDERTGQPVDLEAEFVTFQDALCYRYSSLDKRDKREREVWIAGHQCLHAIIFAIHYEGAFLSTHGHLALFTGCQVKLMRLLQAWQHFATLLPAGTTHGAD